MEPPKPREGTDSNRLSNVSDQEAPLSGIGVEYDHQAAPFNSL